MKRLCQLLTVLLLAAWLGVGAALSAIAAPSVPLAYAAPGAATAAGGPQPATTWYFAEGYASSTFTTYLTLANPNPASAHVSVTYLLGSGSGVSPVVRSYTLAPFVRATINVNGVIGSNNQNVSLVVRSSDQPIVAERPMYYTYVLSDGSGNVPGGSDVLGATSLGQTFAFAYLDTTASHDTWLTILNPNPATLDVTVRYLAADGSAITQTYSVAATSRGTVFVNHQGPGTPGRYSAVVTLSAPGLVERPLYARDGETGYTGGASLVGVPTAQADWYFAEGWVGATAAERYVLANPDPATPASATLTLYRAAPFPAVTTTVTLAPGTQQIISANSVLPSNAGDNSAWVHANSGTLLAERLMSISYGIAVGTGARSSVPGLTDVLGTKAPGRWFYFAEGYTGAIFDEYLTIENPDSSATASLVVSFLPQNGSAPEVRVYQVLAGTRFTLNTGNVMAKQSFSMVVQSDVPIVAERPMYFIYAGSQTGADDVVGYQPPETAPLPALSSCTPGPGVVPVSASVIYTGNASQRQVSITFDSDGGDPGNATAYLDILKSEGVNATFFVTGQFANANPAIVKRIIAEGHDLGNHTFDHPSLPTLTDSGICQELNQADQADAGATLSGRTARPFLRPPYGDIGADQSGHTVQSVAAGLGYRTIYWSIDPRDWDPNTTTQDIINRVLGSPSLAPGAIILMHVNSANEKYALDTVIKGLKARGYSIVPLRHLLG